MSILPASYRGPCALCGDSGHSDLICWMRPLRYDLSRLWDAVALWVALWRIDTEYTGPPFSYWPYRDDV